MKAIIIRDNRYKLNWGCRATTNALETILTEKFDAVSLPPIHDIHATLPVRGSPDIALKEPMEAATTFLRAATHGDLDDDGEMLFASLKAADVAVINLEGCGILSTPFRRDLRFSNFVVVLAAEMGKAVAIVNGMLSRCPSTPTSQQAVEETASAFNTASFVSFRDLKSQAIAQEFGIQQVRHHPDALFAWREQFVELFQSGLLPIQALQGFPERFGSHVTSAETSRPIVISAGSKHPSDIRSHTVEFYRELVRCVRRDFEHPVVLLAPGGDYFLADIANEQGVTFVEAETNVLVGAKFLSTAGAYISGRYHPSIMASLGGTSCVFLESNSHKTESLSTLLGDKSYSSLRTHDESDVPAVIESLKTALTYDRTRSDRAVIAATLAARASSLVDDLFSELNSPS